MIDPLALPHPSPRELLIERLDLIQRLTAHVCSRFGLRGDEARELGSQVMLKLVDDDYAVLRGFAGRSRLSTYLTAVIVNLARDFCCQRGGRWRPSAAARRLGGVAMELERLLEREGFSLRESIEILRRHHRVGLSPVELADLASQLPPRCPRRFTSCETLAELPTGERAAARLEARRHDRTLRSASRALAAAMAELTPEDRLILRMRYASGLKVSIIARTLGLAQRPLYARIERCLGSLRRRLEKRGIEGDLVLEALRENAV